MKSFFKFLIIGTFLFLCYFTLSAENETAVISRVDAKLFPEQYKGEIVMANYDGKNQTEVRLLVYRKGDKVIVYHKAPAILEGQTLLRDNDSMWMYFPRSKKVISIGAKEKSMGGEASNADIMRTDLNKDYDAKYLGNEKVNDINCYKFELISKNRSVAYDRILYWISIEKEVPVRKELYTLSGKMLKYIIYKEIKKIGEYEIPSVISIVNNVNEKYHTDITTVSVDSSAVLSDSLFTLTSIQRGF